MFRRSLIIAILFLAQEARAATSPLGFGPWTLHLGPWTFNQLSGKVADENSVVVAGAQISLNGPALTEALYATSDETGRFQLGPLPPGVYELKVEKRGFYAFVSHAIEVGTRALSIEVTLNHQQEYEETVNVVYSAPTIDPEEAT